MPDDPAADLVLAFADLYDALLEATREGLLEGLERRVPLAAEQVVARHGEITTVEALRAGYMLGLMDALQRLDAGEELIRQALEIAAERKN